MRVSWMVSSLAVACCPHAFAVLHELPTPEAEAEAEAEDADAARRKDWTPRGGVTRR